MTAQTSAEEGAPALVREKPGRARPPRTVIHDECVGRIPFSAREVWPILSKTDWLNQALGLPAVSYTFEPEATGGAAVLARAKLFGLELRWKELPFEWVQDEYHLVNREFETGAALHGRLGIQLAAEPGGTTLVLAHSDLRPRSAAGALLLKHVVGPAANRSMRRVLKHVTDHLSGLESDILPKLPKTAPAEVPLQAGLQKLRPAIQQEALTAKFEQLLRHAPDAAVSHLRPFAIAKEWKTNRWEVLRLFLHATRSGLLDLGWEILCPFCRSARHAPVRSLGEMPATTHCDVCQIRYDAEFDKSVELIFSVNATIRPVERRIYCIAGPGGMPHIVAQYYLAPGESRSCRLPFGDRNLRLRSPQASGMVPLERGALPREIACHQGGFEALRGERKEEERGLRITNPNSFPVRVVVENPEWSDEILTASRVTSWQDFRDLFETQMISPREQFSVRSQVILFTDLRGSTALYNKIGDAPAYVVVRDHFTVLLDAIREHHGAVVKTIGDAVMASFGGVEEALQAVRAMHRQLTTLAPPAGAAERVLLKSGLHIGACLAVNANDKLDFFGATVNLAARLVGCCKGGDLTVSNEFYQRPETAEFLASLGKNAEQTEVRFRGFDRPHTVWRVEMI